MFDRHFRQRKIGQTVSALIIASSVESNKTLFKIVEQASIGNLCKCLLRGTQVQALL